jgi:hypothetical protein
MPYAIKKNTAGKYCVHKADAKGEPIGDPISKCHDTPKEAGAQIAAIEHSEDQKKSMSNVTNNFYLHPDSSTFLDEANWTTITDNTTGFVYYEIDASDGTYVKKQVRPEVGGGVDVDKLKDSDFVFPDERKFPVVTPKDVKDAVNSWGRYKGKKTFEAFKKKLTALAKRKGEKFTAALPEEWKKDMKKSVKAFSLDQYRKNISEAWNDEDTWVSEVFDDHVIVKDANNKMYLQVPYTADDDGSNVEFSEERNEIQLKDEWLEKAASRLQFNDFAVDKTESQSVNSSYAIKALGENRIGAYGILWGTDQEKDLHEEFFTANTKDLTSIFDTVGVVPFIVHHAKDDQVEKFVVGVVDVMEMDSKGLWWEAKIKEFEVYKEYVQPLLDRNALFSSSGTLPAAKRVEKNGEITRWPVAEMSGTWIPAEYRMLEVPITEIKSVYSELGLDTKFMDKFDNNNEPDDQDTQDTKGAEKAQLKTWIDLKFVELGLLEIEN